MPGDLKEECGIAAVYLKKPLEEYSAGGASYFLYKMLLQLQHRGQLSAGITTYNNKRPQLINTYKKLGSVNEVFKIKRKDQALWVLNKYAGTAGIGHVRYATSGSEEEALAHPFERHHGRKWKWFAFAMNGNIANYAKLKKELQKKDYHLPRNSDTELVLHYLVKEFVGSKRIPLEKVFGNISKKFDGSYNIAYIDAEGTIAVLRDPYGFRPLSYAEDDEKILIASESSALLNLSLNGFKDVKPGEILIIKNGKLRIKRFSEQRKCSHCMFEWVYFANPSSILDGTSVYQARYNLGRELAKKEFLSNQDSELIVVGVPDTAKPMADAYAHHTGIPLMEGLLRNRYIGRTFIEGQSRAERVREKFLLNKPILKGKKVILIEDSMVRGTTSKELIKYIRESGEAKEVHLRSASPPIMSPCFYGIDMSTVTELIAAKNTAKKIRERTPIKEVTAETLEKIRKEIDADSVMYQSIEGLVNAINKEKKQDLCLACLNGVYPTPEGKKLRKKALASFVCGAEKRTYE
ncbi:MAG: amidophosphoribosyltransferase [Candidatus Diapherotrites archaeon]|nr:amidophosphoribosyltransferase [Candidatus Diapherotrites archaeon]